MSDLDLLLHAYCRLVAEHRRRGTRGAEQVAMRQARLVFELHSGHSLVDAAARIDEPLGSCKRDLAFFRELGEAWWGSEAA